MPVISTSKDCREIIEGALAVWLEGGRAEKEFYPWVERFFDHPQWLRADPPDRRGAESSFGMTVNVEEIAGGELTAAKESPFRGAFSGRCSI
jgi:hypothetical protein